MANSKVTQELVKAYDGRLIKKIPKPMLQITYDEHGTKTKNQTQPPPTRPLAKEDYYGSFFYAFMISTQTSAGDWSLKSRFFHSIMTRANGVVENGGKDRT